LLLWLEKPSVHDCIFAFSAFALFLRVCLALLQSLALRTPEFGFLGYADKLSPILHLVTLVLLEVVTLDIVLAYRDRVEDKAFIRTLRGRILIILMLLGSTAVLVSLTGMGIAPVYQGDWGRGLPAVPLLEWQIVLACLLCIGMIVFETSQKTARIPRPDFWIPAALWLISLVLWVGQPVVPSPSALKPHEPNFEFIHSTMRKPMTRIPSPF